MPAGFAIHIPPSSDRPCVGCGCTDQQACPEGCVWVLPGICSACCAQAEPIELVALFFGPKAAADTVQRVIDAMPRAELDRAVGRELAGEPLHRPARKRRRST